MPSARTRFVIAFALALSFAGSAGVACTSKPPTPICPGTGGADAGAGGAPFSAEGAGGADPSIARCASCLDTVCGYQKKQCLDPAVDPPDDGGPSDCLAIQACIDSVCFNLSATYAADEVDCQVYCQGLHPHGKVAQVAWVDCVRRDCCEPPCAGYPYDYDTCVIAQNAGACQQVDEACKTSSECQAYQSCASTCTTFPACQKCATVPGGALGEQQYEAWQICLDTTCFAQGWLPSI